MKMLDISEIELDAANRDQLRTWAREVELEGYSKLNAGPLRAALRPFLCVEVPSADINETVSRPLEKFKLEGPLPTLLPADQARFEAFATQEQAEIDAHEATMAAAVPDWKAHTVVTGRLPSTPDLPRWPSAVDTTDAQAVALGGTETQIKPEIKGFFSALGFTPKADITHWLKRRGTRPPTILPPTRGPLPPDAPVWAKTNARTRRKWRRMQERLQAAVL